MKDYIVLKEYDYYQYEEVLLFNRELTNGDLERIQQVIDTVRDEVEDYTIEDIKDAIKKVCPYDKCISVSGHNVMYY